jgi:hypothetical protein
MPKTEQTTTLSSNATADVKVRKTKKVKAVREGPKKNQSAYLHFCSEERQNIKNEESEVSSKQILSEMGARWKTLSEREPERFKRYQDVAAADKERYAHEKSEYESTRKQVSGNDDDDEEPAQKPKRKTKAKQAEEPEVVEDAVEEVQEEEQPVEEEVQEEEEEVVEEKPKKKVVKKAAATEEKPKKRGAKKA